MTDEQTGDAAPNGGTPDTPLDERGLGSPSHQPKEAPQAQNPPEAADARVASDQGDIGSADDAREGTSESTTPADSLPESQAAGDTDEQAAARAKNTTQEAFNSLRDNVLGLRSDFATVNNFIGVCWDKLDKLSRKADEYKFEGMMAVIDPLTRLHETIFTRVIAMEAGNATPDMFAIALLEQLEDDLEFRDIKVIRPHPGDDLDLELMTTVGGVRCPFWRKPGKVAQVICCGFVLRTERGEKLLGKAKVTMYRRTS